MGYSHTYKEHHRIIVVSEGTSNHPMKIYDLNDDCLAKIFDRLSLQSLFHVALANKWLRSAANDVYKRKFGRKEVRFCVDSSQMITRLFEKETKIFVNGQRMCLQYLRCFGPSIGNFEIFHINECKRNHCKFIRQYIQKYCGSECLATKKNVKNFRYPTELQKFSYKSHKCSKCFYI